MPIRKAGPVLAFLPELLRNDLTDNASFRERFDVTVDATVTFGEADGGTSRNALYEAIRLALKNEGPGSYSVADRSGKPWAFEVRSGAAARLVILLPGGIEVGLPHGYAFSPHEHERRAGFLDELEGENVSEETISEWLEHLEKGPLENEVFWQLHMDLSATPGAVERQIEEVLAEGRLPANILAPEDERYYSRLIGSPPALRTFEDFLAWFSESYFPAAVAKRGTAALVESTFLSAHPLITTNIGGFVLTAASLSEVCDSALGAGLIPRLAAIELVLQAPEPIGNDVLASFETLVASLTTVDLLKPDSLFARFAALAAFSLSHIASLRLLADRGAHERRLAGFAHASVLEKHLIAAGIEVEPEDLGEVTDTPALFFGSMVDFRQLNLWHADYLNPTDLYRWTIIRLFLASIRHAENPLGKKLLDRVAVDRNDVAFSIWNFRTPDLMGHNSSPELLAPDVYGAIETDLSTNPLTINSFIFFIKVNEAVGLSREAVNLAIAAIAKARYTIGQSDDASKMLWLLRGLAYASARNGSQELAEQVRILVRNSRQLYGAIGFENEVRLLLVCAGSMLEAEPWAAFVEEWLRELAYTDLSSTEAYQLRTAVSGLAYAAPEFAKVSSKVDAVLAAVMWSPE